jgi:hypothetical protein
MNAERGNPREMAIGWAEEWRKGIENEPPKTIGAKGGE